MSFVHPWCLALLALPLLLAAWELSRRGQAVPLPLDHAATRAPRWAWRLVRAANLLPAVLVAIAIVLLAAPQRQGEPEQERVLTNIELCLDLSGSMKSPFGDKGSRYDGAMAAIVEFTTRRQGDAFGLTVFGNEVLRWTPLTQDLAVIRDATPWLRPEMMPRQFNGTEIGKALKSCLATITAQGVAEGDRMVVLLSDGQSYDLDQSMLQDLIRGFVEAGVVFFMVFIGDEAPNPELFTLAATTGGRIFPTNDPSGLRGCFAHIDRMRPARLAPRAVQPVDCRWPWALAGLIAVALHGLCLLGLRFTPW